MPDLEALFGEEDSAFLPEVGCLTAWQTSVDYRYGSRRRSGPLLFPHQFLIRIISLDGEVFVLAATRLRGNVSAAGTLTTTWGELKS